MPPTPAPPQMIATVASRQLGEGTIDLVIPTTTPDDACHAAHEWAKAQYGSDVGFRVIRLRPQGGCQSEDSDLTA